jgi:hypothetical protein
MAEQSERLAAATKQAEEAKAAAASTATIGVPPLGAGSGKQPQSVSGDAIAEFGDEHKRKGFPDHGPGGGNRRAHLRRIHGRFGVFGFFLGRIGPHRRQCQPCDD